MSTLEDAVKEYLDKGILSGKAYSDLIRNEIKEEVEKMDTKPFLATIIVGEDEGSKIYVSFKEKACNNVGIGNTVFRLPTDSTQEEVLNKITELNNDPSVDGILLQLPLPGHLKETDATMTISPEKDADGLHYINAGKLNVGMESVLPCTPAGIMEMLVRSGVEFKGKNAVVIGRSNLVGKPIFRLLEQKHCTVTVCHSRTQNLPEIARNADILVAAIGRAQFVKGDMVKEGAIVVDVGMNRLDTGKVVGDVDFNAVKEKASLITPVPGGVGPMTITMLLQNTLKAHKKKHGLE
ncbi:MAG: bifunctional methylenetetrahydrofolate dehydrogenase/methenyltetrahydrofolate cyclohydrolase FolD [Candidatus Kariarchaeaceae archaeon]|jgi:methylenetetrahydrofolate dehydrogenase (NADP+)/methenyltetrahydrofolate cyclohydrolase